MPNKTLERDQAYCAAFRECLVQENLSFYREFLGLKSLAPQLPVRFQKRQQKDQMKPRQNNKKRNGNQIKINQHAA